MQVLINRILVIVFLSGIVALAYLVMAVSILFENK